jgi:hypothetical protein
LDDRGPFYPQALEFVLAYLGHSRVVASPPVDAVSESFYLTPPLRVRFVNLPGPDQEDVDVALDPTVTSRYRPENRHMEGRRLPELESFLQASEEPGPEIRQFDDWFGRNVIPVQLVDAGPSGVVLENETVLDETVEHPLRSVLGTFRLPCHLSTSARSSGG